MVAQIDGTYPRIAGASATLRRLWSYAMFEGRPATTRGQWFNPVVDAHLRLAERVGGPPVERPIFVVGVGRSGTTHLARLLSAHPDVGWLNEPKLLWNRIVPGEDVSGFYSPHGRFALDADDATPEVRRRARQLFGFYLRSTRATRVVDKYPELTYRIPFLTAIFPDARIVAIVRRPEEFVSSVLEWNRVHATADQDWWGVGRCKWQHLRQQLLPAHPDVARALARSRTAPTEAQMILSEWIIAMRHLCASEDDLCVTISHDELVTDTDACVRTVLAGAGLSAHPSVLRLAGATTRSGATASSHTSSHTSSHADLDALAQQAWERVDGLRDRPR